METSFLKTESKGGCRVAKATFKDGERTKKFESFQAEDLPESIDWRNKDGTNYCSWNKN